MRECPLWAAPGGEAHCLLEAGLGGPGDQPAAVHCAVQTAEGEGEKPHPLFRRDSVWNKGEGGRNRNKVPSVLTE